MFAVSKIVWWLVDPANLLLIVLVFGAVVSSARRFRRLGRRVLAVATAGAVLVSVLPLGTWLLRPLEQRFPAMQALPENLTGLITVGGAVNQFITAERDQVALTAGAERLTAFVGLARRRPDLRLVYTGGSGALLRQDLKETTVARRFFAEMGLDPAPVIFEGLSRNTFENAVNSAALLRPAQGNQVWLLITSAAHMPRTVGVFRKAGFTILPYPVDYQTSARSAGYGAGLRAGLNLLSSGVYEWLGLIAYRLLGRTDDLFPAP